MSANGCGSDGQADRDAFRTAADRVCVRANAAAALSAIRISTAQRGSDPAVVYRTVATLTHRRAKAARVFIDQLDALEVPDDERSGVKQWIADQRRRQTLVDALGDAFAARDDARISTLSQRIDAANSASIAFAAKHGLLDCSRGTA